MRLNARIGLGTRGFDARDLEVDWNSSINRGLIIRLIPAPGGGFMDMARPWLGVHGFDFSNTTSDGKTGLIRYGSSMGTPHKLILPALRTPVGHKSFFYKGKSYNADTYGSNWMVMGGGPNAGGAISFGIAADGDYAALRGGVAWEFTDFPARTERTAESSIGCSQNFNGSTTTLTLDGVGVSTTLPWYGGPTSDLIGFNCDASGDNAGGMTGPYETNVPWRTFMFWDGFLPAEVTKVLHRDPYAGLRMRRRTTYFPKATNSVVTRAIAGTCSVVVGGPGSVEITRPIAGTSAAAFGGSGEVQITRAIAGTCSVTTGASGEILIARSISGTAAVALGGTGTVNVGNDIAIAGTCAVAVGGSGQIIVTRPIAGTSTAIFSGSGQLIVTRSIAGACAVILTGTGTVTNSPPFVAPAPLRIGVDRRGTTVRLRTRTISVRLKP